MSCWLCVVQVAKFVNGQADLGKEPFTVDNDISNKHHPSGGLSEVVKKSLTHRFGVLFGNNREFRNGIWT
jgi:hypothetical protein